jgi:hypothetical protein
MNSPSKRVFTGVAKCLKHQVLNAGHNTKSDFGKTKNPSMGLEVVGSSLPALCR